MSTDRPRVEWINKTERMPTEADCDLWGCVLIYDRLNGVKVTGYRNAGELGRSGVTHWARMPLGPGETNGAEKIHKEAAR